MNTYEGFAAMLCGQHDNAEAISAGPWVIWGITCQNPSV